ncbi:MAG: arylsulfatase [Lewinellaceae bacterium]|nr:arylsulfatase [Lewinellaceae bacterium]
MNIFTQTSVPQKGSVAIVLVLFALCLLAPSCQTNSEKSATQIPEKRPNIIVFYVDDLGFGDLSCYGARGVTTPNVDRLANEGIRFTDAHSTASTCTPSRYSLLTGRYAFRNKAAILPGDAPLLIEPGSYTLPRMLKQAGYKTGVVGKWHLGLGNGTIDWNGEVKPGPLEIGFDYSFILPATGDRVPTVYLENHRVANLAKTDKPIVVDYEMKLTGYPNGIDNPELLRQKADPQHSNTIVNGISRIGYMEGGESALWVDEEFPQVLTEKAEKFIANAKQNPFFLYFAFHDIHVPRLPNKQFVGKSTMGPRGDVIAQMDWVTGKIIRYLEEKGLAENTLVIFTSDNGPVLNDGYEDQAEELLGNHQPSGPFRGGKYSAYEAGTRVPMIVYWPGKTSRGASKTPISQIDLYASLAALAGQELADDEAIDSDNNLQALLDHTKQGSEFFLEESFTTQIRQGDWKYIEPFSSTKKIPTFMNEKGVEGGFEFFPQLFNLSTDKAEQSNVAKDNAEVVKSLQAEIDRIRTKTTREAPPN